MSARREIRLPALVRWSPTGLIYLVYWAPFIALYQLTNRFPVFAPRELPFTWLDHAVPFVPALLPVYVAYIPFYWWTATRARNDAELNRLFYGAHLQLALSLACFVAFPVRMPIEHFYGAGSHGFAAELWRWFDEPNNCFPSLHVSNSLLLLHFNWRRPHRFAYAAVSLAIAASTVLVKQHYVIDVAGGILVYLAARSFLARLRLTGISSDGWIAGRAAPSQTGEAMSWLGAPRPQREVP